jgi:predicted transcriptional regulator
MNPGLLDLILFSEKRKAFLLLLTEGPMNIEDMLEKLQVPRTALLPQIKKLKEENLVIHKNGVYRLSLIGEIIVEKMKPLVETLAVFEKNEDFWTGRKLSAIPPYLIKRIGDLGNYTLIETDLGHTFDLSPEFVKHLSNSTCIHMFFSYFHPQFPTFFLELAKKGIKISLILSEAVCLRLEEDFKKEKEEFLKMEKANLAILDIKEIEVPAVIVSTDKIMILGLFNESGRFDLQYVMSFDEKAIKWGEEFFKYFKDISRGIK